ncbi:hypothetical protein BH09PSE5_BH09PSE5_21660 [soil metagenome]
MRSQRGFVIGILGAESTGKTVLARDLAQALTGPTAQESASSTGLQAPRVALVGEWLREFCEIEGRTPRVDEQAGIAAEQTRRIALAAADNDIVVTDTTALMIAVYSEIVFGDTSLYASAEESHRRCDLTLLTALDLPWQADGLQRDGPHVREPVDTLVRASLQRAASAYAVITGAGPARLEAALAAVRSAMHASTRDELAAEGSPVARWTTTCGCCGDPDCERRLFTRP